MYNWRDFYHDNEHSSSPQGARFPPIILQDLNHFLIFSLSGSPYSFASALIPINVLRISAPDSDTKKIAKLPSRYKEREKRVRNLPVCL